MRLRRAAMFALGLGVSGAVVVTISRSADLGPRESVHRAAREPAVSEPIAALQREIELLKLIARRPQAVPAPSGSTRAQDTPAASPAPGPTPEPARALQPVEVAERLEDHFMGEPADRVWSDQVRSELQAALSAQPTGTRMTSAECATSLCKVTLLHETTHAQRELASTVASLPALGAGVFYHYEQHTEPPRTVLYVVREGHDIREMVAVR
jgi:hypothetical protein